jgi:hypothetical protein
MLRDYDEEQFGKTVFVRNIVNDIDGKATDIFYGLVYDLDEGIVIGITGGCFSHAEAQKEVDDFHAFCEADDSDMRYELDTWYERYIELGVRFLKIDLRSINTSLVLWWNNNAYKPDQLFSIRRISFFPIASNDKWIQYLYEEYVNHSEDAMSIKHH